ncbi:hypothetical protein CK203_038795 [Vitis vinifera]|uniref:Photolyase/cryptochrome alpha/beta domain-containing protein n=1 Tax=Vitis vinifera TaxID=29760 RepID=A0A438I1Q3_VITVI|nr:hypothetical protein CK203_038795 [Vitis vinifera]
MVRTVGYHPYWVYDPRRNFTIGISATHGAQDSSALLLESQSQPISMLEWTSRSIQTLALMSLLTFPGFLSFSFSPNTLSFGRPRSRFPLAASKGAESSAIDDSVAVLWFKHDLRIDDHPGLVAAASRHRTVIPLYVFDRRILSRELSLLFNLFGC